jgi:hypothetical protein
MLLAIKIFLENIYERKTPLMNSLKLQDDIKLSMMNLELECRA